MPVKRIHKMTDQTRIQYTREEAIERLMKGLKSSYDIYMDEDDSTPIVARCEFFEHSGKYMLSRKMELWTADHEEFLYLISIPHLTMELYEKWRDYVQSDGMERLNIEPGHMSSFITPVFICDSCEEDARRALKKCRIFKSFQFSLNGWMDHHTALAELSTGSVDANRGGRHIAKFIKKALV